MIEKGLSSVLSKIYFDIYSVFRILISYDFYFIYIFKHTFLTFQVYFAQIAIDVKDVLFEHMNVSMIQNVYGLHQWINNRKIFEKEKIFMENNEDLRKRFGETLPPLIMI